MAEMRRVVVEEAQSPLEVTDGFEYMLVSLRSAIDTSLNALESSVTLNHYSTREPLVGCPNPDQDYWTAPLDPDGRLPDSRQFGRHGLPVDRGLWLCPQGRTENKGLGVDPRVFPRFS